MKSKFNERIKKLRVENGISQNKLAVALNVGRQTIVNWEIRGSEPNLTTLMYIAKFFNVTTDYLIGMVDEI